MAPPALPDGPNNRIYDSFDVGTLMRFNLVDTRQYREESAEDASILGAEQEQWLNDKLATSPAQWNVVVNSVVVVPIADSTDQWDGFPQRVAGLSNPFPRSVTRLFSPAIFISTALPKSNLNPASL